MKGRNLKSKINTEAGDNEEIRHILINPSQVYFDLIWQHLLLLFIGYFGFIRLLSSRSDYRKQVVFSHLFELLTQNIPVTMLQIINNKNLGGKWQTPLDTICITLASLNLLDLLLEMCMA